MTSTALYLGSNGFPFGSAMIQRQVQMAKLCLRMGINVTVINNRSPHSKSISKRENISVHGFFQEIEYIYCSLIPYRSTNFLIRNISKLIGKIFEFFTIIYYVKFKNVNFFICNTVDLNELKYYYSIAKFFKIELIYDYVEYIDSIGGKRNELNFNQNKSGFDNNFIRYVDKLFIISDYLLRHINKISNNVPKIKIPPIIDFTYFDRIKPNQNLSPFFLFCGAAAFEDVIEYIVNSYIKSIATENNYKLFLILYGSTDQLKRVESIVERKKCANNIVILTQLSYDDLLTYYKSAKALLIPLGNNIQDLARFPFKICEYSASKRPIITSDSGSILEYFENNKTAFIAKTDDLSDFTNKINEIVSHPILANNIGQNGYELGLKVFNSEAYLKDFKQFILN